MSEIGKRLDRISDELEEMKYQVDFALASRDREKAELQKRIFELENTLRLMDKEEMSFAARRHLLNAFGITGENNNAEHS